MNEKMNKINKSCLYSGFSLPGIRRFIRELDQDGRLYELFYKRNIARHTMDSDSDTEEGKILNCTQILKY